MKNSKKKISSGGGGEGMGEFGDGLGSVWIVFV